MKRCRSYRVVLVGLVMLAGSSLHLSIVVAHGPESQGTYVTTKAVDLKRGPGQNYDAVRKFRKGTTFEIVGKEGGWLKVQLSEHDHHFGYIDQRSAVIKEQHEDIILKPAIPGAYFIAAPIIVRRGPGDTFAVVSKLPKGTKIVVIGMDGGWLRLASKRGDPPKYVERRTSPLEHAD